MGIFAIDPPRKVDDELLKNTLKEMRIPAEFVNPIACPRMHWRVYIAKGKLIGG